MVTLMLFLRTRAALTLNGLLFTAFVALSGCSNLQTAALDPVSMNLAAIEILPAKGLQQKFKLTFDLQNPNGQLVRFQGMRYSIDLNQQKVLAGVSNQLPELAAYSEGSVEVIASTQLLGIIRLLNTLASAPDTEFQYTLNATLDVANHFTNMVVNETGTIPLLSQ